MLLNCGHVKDEDYGQCRGEEREDLLKQLSPVTTADGLVAQPIIWPKTIMDMEDKSPTKSAANALNHGDKAIKLYTAYNAKREAKKNSAAWFDSKRHR